MPGVDVNYKLKVPVVADVSQACERSDVKPATPVHAWLGASRRLLAGKGWISVALMQ
jgi:hypothetical protein